MADSPGKASKRQRFLRPFQSGFDKIINLAQSSSRPSSPLPSSSAQVIPSGGGGPTSPASPNAPGLQTGSHSSKIQGASTPGMSARSTMADTNSMPSAGYVKPVALSQSNPTERFKGAGSIGFAGLEAALRTLEKSVGALPPLKQALSGFIACLDIIQAMVACEEGYEQCTLELTGIANTINQYITELGPEGSNGTAIRISRSVEVEVALINERQRRSIGRRLVESTEDREDVVKCYRKIESLFRELQNDISLRTWRNTSKQYSMTLLQSMSPIDDAMYNSSYSTTVKRRGCTADTRRKVQEDIQHWIQDPNGAKVYWMNGMAGTGKTTIAYSVCEWLKVNKLLGASFFCSRVSSACRNVNLIVPTIAYQLALVSQSFQLALCKVLETDPSISKQNVVQQFETLIRDPLMMNEDAIRAILVIVIDALDECEDDYGVRLVLGALLKLGTNLPLKFLITSRPEPAIQEYMLSPAGYSPAVLYLHDIEQSVVEEDIKKHLTEALAVMSPPPSIEQIEELATLSGKLFIYAATAIRYITSGGGYAMARLNSMLTRGHQPTENRKASKRYKELDELYTTVLASALDSEKLETEEVESMQMVLWTVACAKEPMTVSTLALFLGFATEEVVAALDPLYSVLHVSGDRKVISTLHASFTDYMLDQLRSKSYYCDKGKHNAILANRCFAVMRARLKFNICNLESSFKFDKDVHSLEEEVEARIPPVLFYACLHWGGHLRLADVSPPDALDQDLNEFLNVRMLFWMEVLNLKQCIVQGILVLAHAETWLSVLVISTINESRKRVADARDFVARFAASACSRSTPHIYLSALSFCARTSSVYTQYQKLVKGLIDVSGTAISQRDRAARATWKTGSPVRSIAFSHDGARIVSGSGDMGVRVWDIGTGEVVAGPFKGHAKPVQSVAFSSNGEHVASGSSDETIRVWNARTGDSVVGPFGGHTDEVNSVAFSPDGTRVASGSRDTTIRVWYTHTGDTAAGPLEGHIGTVCAVAFSPDGARIVSGSADSTVRVWDACTGALAAGPFKGHNDTVKSVAFAPNGTWVVSGSDDTTIRVWDARTGDLAAGPFAGHTDYVLSVAFSHDSARIVSGSRDETIRIWDSRTGDMIAGPLIGHTNRVNLAVFSPDATYIVSGSNDHTIRVWDAYSRNASACECKPLQAGHSHFISSVAFSPGGAQIATGSHDTTVRVWDAHTGSLVAGPFQGHTDWVKSVTFSPDGGRVASGSDDRTIHVWDARTGDVVSSPFRGHDDSVLSVAFSPNGALVVSGSRDNTIRVWDARTGNPIAGPFIGHTGSVNSVVFSPDGTRILSGSADTTARVWNVLTGKVATSPFQGHTNAVRSVAFSPSGMQIVSGSRDGTVYIWDAHSGGVVTGPFKWHTGPVMSVAFRPDGTHLVSSSDDKTVVVWEACNGNIVVGPSKLRGHTSAVRSVALSPDGVYIASGSEDQAIRVSSVYPAPANQELQLQLLCRGMLSRIGTQNGSESYSTLKVNSGEQSANSTIPASNTPQSTAIIDFECRDDGWVMSNDIPLFWTPPDLRSVIPYPQDRVVIGYPGSLSMDYEHALFGERWTECYNPA